MTFEIENGNGNIKEYDSFGSLDFEGEYKNGERNGKGKEYYLGKLQFDGEYLNGKRWKGKEYSRDNLVYDGEYSNGERNGK